MTLRTIFVLLFGGLLAAGCDSGGGAPDEGLRYFRFVHTTDSSTYVAATSDSTALAQVEAQLKKPLDDRDQFIIGPIAHGDGGHNDGYPWHFVESEWRLTEVATEVCDGRPSFVSENVDYFVDEVGRYCPWNSRVLEEIEAP